MPKKGKKKAAKKGGADINLEDEASFHNKILKDEVQALQMDYMVQHTALAEATANMKEYQNKYEILSDDFEKEKNTKFAISMNMTRQYKMMREKLLNKINQLMGQIGNYQEKLQQQKQECDLEIQKKNQVIEEKNKEIARWKLKNDENEQEFAQMLKQTLEKMSETIVVQNEPWSEEKSELGNEKLNTFLDEAAKKYQSPMLQGLHKI